MPRRVSLQQAIELVQRATRGRILEAKEFGDQDRIFDLQRRGARA